MSKLKALTNFNFLDLRNQSLIHGIFTHTTQLMIKLILLAFIFFSFFVAQAQNYSNDMLVDESVLAARTKQLGQFIRRFNSEEGRDGVKFFTTNPKYHNQEERKLFIPYLFDDKNEKLTSALKTDFINDVTASGHDKYIDFLGDMWFAEVAAHFKYYGQEVEILLFMRLVPENKGSKWVIANTHFDQFNSLFSPQSDATAFLHPLSHEIAFMNLKNAFDDKQKVQLYAQKDFQPSYNTLLFYEIKRGNLKFEYVSNVKFHFLQLDGWYFELTDFNRTGSNAGWLISNLYRVPESEKKSFINYIYHE